MPPVGFIFAALACQPVRHLLRLKWLLLWGIFGAAPLAAAAPPAPVCAEVFGGTTAFALNGRAAPGITVLADGAAKSSELQAMATRLVGALPASMALPSVLKARRDSQANADVVKSWVQEIYSLNVERYFSSYGEFGSQYIQSLQAQAYKQIFCDYLFALYSGHLAQSQVSLKEPITEFLDPKNQQKIRQKLDEKVLAVTEPRLRQDRLYRAWIVAMQELSSVRSTAEEFQSGFVYNYERNLRLYDERLQNGFNPKPDLTRPEYKEALRFDPFDISALGAGTFDARGASVLEIKGSEYSEISIVSLDTAKQLERQTAFSYDPNLCFYASRKRRNMIRELTQGKVTPALVSVQVEGGSRFTDHSWAYHQATALLVRDVKNRVGLYVLDVYYPGLVPLETWLRAYTVPGESPGNSSFKVYVTGNVGNEMAGISDDPSYPFFRYIRQK